MTDAGVRLVEKLDQLARVHEAACIARAIDLGRAHRRIHLRLGSLRLSAGVRVARTDQRQDVTVRTSLVYPIHRVVRVVVSIVVGAGTDDRAVGIVTRRLRGLRDDASQERAVRVERDAELQADLTSTVWRHARGQPELLVAVETQKVHLTPGSAHEGVRPRNVGSTCQIEGDEGHHASATGDTDATIDDSLGSRPLRRGERQQARHHHDSCSREQPSGEEVASGDGLPVTFELKQRSIRVQRGFAFHVVHL